MYATCLFCNGALGANEALEVFPVGRRIAFDAAAGRLWVVCRGCERWNLSPLEERWEAIDSAERLYRGSRLRASTDQIGMARLADGTELVRVGRPLRAEFAAWRYGDQFGRRRRQRLLHAGLVLAAGGAAIGAGWVVGGIATLNAWQYGSSLLKLARDGRGRTVVARMPLADGRVLRVRRSHLTDARLERGPANGPVLRVTHDDGVILFTDDDAWRAAGALFPAANRGGGTAHDVSTAVARLEHAGGPERYLAALIARQPGADGDAARPAGTGRAARWGALAREESSPFSLRSAFLLAPPPSTGLPGMALSVRLAVEMAVHEERERRAMEGELAQLEAAWRDAERIAAIADTLVVPTAVERAMTRLRARVGRAAG